MTGISLNHTTVALELLISVSPEPCCTELCIRFSSYYIKHSVFDDGASNILFSILQIQVIDNARKRPVGRSAKACKSCKLCDDIVR